MASRDQAAASPSWVKRPLEDAADDLLDAIGELYGCGDIRHKYELEDARREAVEARAALLTALRQARSALLDVAAVASQSETVEARLHVAGVKLNEAIAGANLALGDDGSEA